MKENDFFLPPKKKNGDVVLFMFSLLSRKSG